MKIYPAILSDQPMEIKQQLAKAAAVKAVKLIQFDIIDSYFADNVTVTPTDLNQFELKDKQIDLHFMTHEPLDTLYETRNCQDLPIRSVIAQVEKMSSQKHFIKEAKNEDWQPGLSLDLFTPLSAIDQASWTQLDVLQIMAIQAGFQGQKFNFLALEKLQQAAEFIAERNLAIELIVDGGVKLDNVVAVARAGADAVSVGSGLWQAEDFASKYKQYQQKVSADQHD